MLAMFIVFFFFFLLFIYLASSYTPQMQCNFEVNQEGVQTYPETCLGRGVPRMWFLGIRGKLFVSYYVLELHLIRYNK